LGILPKDFYSMTYAEYILTFQGYLRKYYNDFNKHRVTAYQVYCSIPKKGNNVSMTRFLPLPIDDMTVYDPEKIRTVRQLFIDKLRKEKGYG
jgi:hypothetical protein